MSAVVGMPVVMRSLGVFVLHLTQEFATARLSRRTLLHTARGETD